MPTSSPPDSTDHPAARLVWEVSAAAADACAIHQRAIAGAPPGLVRHDILAHFERHTGADGIMLACMDGGEGMVAYGILGLDSPMAAHLAALLGADPATFALLDGAAALPSWRGYGLHHASVEQRVRHAAARTRQVCGATVSPLNVRAMTSMLRAGFTIHGHALMYGGLERLLMQRDVRLDGTTWTMAAQVPATDGAAHRRALDAGLVGFALERCGAGQWLVSYGYAS